MEWGTHRVVLNGSLTRREYLLGTAEIRVRDADVTFAAPTLHPSLRSRSCVPATGGLCARCVSKQPAAPAFHLDNRSRTLLANRTATSRAARAAKSPRTVSSMACSPLALTPIHSLSANSGARTLPEAFAIVLCADIADIFPVDLKTNQGPSIRFASSAQRQEGSDARRGEKGHRGLSVRQSTLRGTRFSEKRLHCHCRMCQKSCGQPADISVPIKAGTLLFTKSKPKYYVSSQYGKRGFCDDCGSRLHGRL